MLHARMLGIGFCLLSAMSARASDSQHGQIVEESATAHHETALPETVKGGDDHSGPKISKPGTGPVAAMDNEHARSYHVGELINAGAKPMVLISRTKLRAELSPRSIAEFGSDGVFRLLRGSAVVDQAEETSMRTPGAKIEFVGRSLVSYDHAEKSSSVFVLEGEARLVNPHRDDSTVRLSRFRGATIVIGDVLPKLVRQLDVGSVHAWMKGFSWPEERRAAMLKNMPGDKIAEGNPEPEHLKEAKIEDYFSSIDTADEQQQPDYYQKKFDDPDKVVAEANAKVGASKALSPEEAALISLPKTQIDLGFELGPEFITSDEKQAEVRKVEPRSAARRGPASVAKVVKPKAVKKVVSQRMAEQGDPEVNMVMERLRQVRSGNPVYSQMPAPERAPAAAHETVVPDPVYDYSQNF